MQINYYFSNDVNLLTMRKLTFNLSNPNLEVVVPELCSFPEKNINRLNQNQIQVMKAYTSGYPLHIIWFIFTKKNRLIVKHREIENFRKMLFSMFNL